MSAPEGMYAASAEVTVEEEWPGGSKHTTTVTRYMKPMPRQARIDVLVKKLADISEHIKTAHTLEVGVNGQLILDIIEGKYDGA